MRSVFVATQAAVTHMKAGGGIVNIGSWNRLRHQRELTIDGGFTT